MMEDFFQELFSAYERQKAYHDERVKNGDYFNVFNVLGLSSNETRTHSAFIAELLNPHGSHGMGDLFLRKFLSYAHIEDLKLDTKNAYVEVERSIGEIDEDYEHGGRIDLIVESPASKGIIIENKIYAVDQPKQLVRYHNYAESTYSDYRLLYLSLDKEEAPPESTVGNNVQLVSGEDYLAITYRNEILQWLNDCLNELPKDKVVYVIVNQYIELLKQLTYQMEENNIVLDVLKKENNWACTLEVLKNADSWKNKVWSEFVSILREKIEDNGWILENTDVIGDLRVRTVESSEYFVCLTKYAGGAYIGISCTSEQTPKECLPGLESPEPWWPFGWKFLERDYRYFLPLADWNSWEYLFPENRQDFADYLMQEISTIMKEAIKAGINI